MRLYEDGAFIEQEPERRALRDQYRDEFFAALGVERMKDPFGWEPDPTEQLAVVSSLIEKAKGLHNGDTSALQMMGAELSLSMLGVPVANLGGAQFGRPSLDAVSVMTMAENHFHRWMGSPGYDAPNEDRA
jgi:hypothetical protein